MATADLVIGFVDLAGYTALTEAHGDERAAECAQQFYELAQRTLIGDTRIVKRIGDAVMLVGSSPVACVTSVMRMVAVAEAQPEFPGLRAGLHLGPVVERDGDYFGATVNLASRLSAHARTGETLCGATLAAALETDAEVRLVSLGTIRLKNVAHPVAAFSILETRSGDVATGSIDPVCRMRVTEPRVTLPYEGRTYAFCSDACADRFRADPAVFAMP